MLIPPALFAAVLTGVMAPVEPATVASQAPGAFPRFPDVAEQAGVTLLNVSGDATKDYIIETNGNGAGFIDYDDDGDVDLLIANGSTLESYSSGGDPIAALYRNDGARFTDVTVEAGLEATGWGMGVCAADYDNDGHRDFYVTAYGPNVLYRNRGDGTFVEATSLAGVGDPGWGTNCAFGDYDRDGDVDLYVANYLTFAEDIVPRPGERSICRYMGMDVMCGPVGLAGEADLLYRNDGDGTFTDVTDEAGVREPGHYGFGVVFSDLDGDGWPDIYVANDSVPNLLFQNNRDGTFTEVGVISGTALNEAGHAQAGMGVGIGDYDNNGQPDIFVTNFSHDTNTLYQNLGSLLFVDATATAGLGGVSLPHLGWGAGFVDLDNDGRLDIFVSNGHVYPEVDEVEAGTRFLQRKEIYRNVGDGRFEEIASGLEGDLSVERSARGTAFGDYDNDGDIDAIAVNINDRPNLYRNDGGNRNHWITLRLEGTDSNRDAIGASIEIQAGGRTQFGVVYSGGSFLSHNDMRVHFGLGSATRVDAIRIRWPNGTAEELGGVEADRFLRIREGQGVVPED